MKIHAIKQSNASPTALDLAQFSKALRKLSEQFGVRLVSLGNMETVDDGQVGKMYLAVWSLESSERQGN